ncbi:UNVERIFIED_CONTAM: hypothetical protein FKN15_059375 [Acipenser sinensis]
MYRYVTGETWTGRLTYARCCRKRAATPWDSPVSHGSDTERSAPLDLNNKLAVTLLGKDHGRTGEKSLKDTSAPLDLNNKLAVTLLGKDHGRTGEKSLKDT